MRYQLKQIHCRPWTLSGLSLPLIESHYENNYGGAMRRLNAITEQLEKLDVTKAPGFLLGSLKREQLTALNSTLLHELYFARLGDGSGSVLLTYVPRDGRLMNQYATDHTQAVPGGVPILALDMYEHAYHMDFGENAKAYAETFIRNVDWKAVEERYEDAIKVAPPRPLVQEEFKDIPGVGVEDVKAMLDAGGQVQFVDTRPRHFVSRTQDIIDGATWRDPERLQDWIGELSKEKPVVVYCAYGFHVGCRTAGALRDAGFDAKYMTGGHSGWKAMGGPIKMKA